MSKNLLNLLLIVTIFALYYLVINPLYKGVGGVWQPEYSIKALQEMNKQYDETLAQAESVSQQAQALKSDYAKISDVQKQQMKVMVPDSIDKVRLLSEMINISAKTGMPFSELSYSEGTANTSGKGTAAVSFSVKTTYPKFKDFIAEIEKSLRLFSIQSVTFSAPEKGSELMTFQVKLETYHIK